MDAKSRLARYTALVALFGALALLLWLHHLASQEFARANWGKTNLSGLHTVPLEASANNNGVYYASRGQYAQAIGFFKYALSRNSSYLPAYKDLLAAYVETKQWTEARQVGEKAEELFPLSEDLQKDSLPEDEEEVRQLRGDRGFIANLGRAYLETGELSKAASRFTLYLRLAPNELEGYNGLGETAFREGEFERALRLFGQSLKLYADQPKVAARIGEIAKKSDDLAGKAQWVLASYTH